MRRNHNQCPECGRLMRNHRTLGETVSDKLCICGNPKRYAGRKVNIVSVLQDLATGLKLHEIAKRQNVCSTTLKRRLFVSRERKGARTTCELIAMALREGVIE